MESMYTLVGIGFVILCVTILVAVAGIFGYIVHITKKKLEVAPAKVNSKSNDTIE